MVVHVQAIRSQDKNTDELTVQALEESEDIVSKLNSQV